MRVDGKFYVGPDIPEGQGSVNAVAWHPQRHNMFASCSDDGTIRIWRSTAEMGKEEDVFADALTTPGNGHRRDRSFSYENGEAYQAFAIGSNNGGGHEREYSSEVMGPSPFPWATSPRAPNSPGVQQRRARRQAASRRAAAAAAVAAQGASAALSRAIENDDDEEDDDEDDQEGSDDDEEEDSEDEDQMEEGGD